MSGTFVRPTNLIYHPLSQLADFGPKTAGCVGLMYAAPRSPRPYQIPPFWGIPAGQHDSVSDGHLRSAYDNLVKGMGDRGVLMIRSSALDEEPGKNPTYLEQFDKKDNHGSFMRFRDSVHRLGEESDSMGILLMPMVGEEVIINGGVNAFGWNNVSFVANSHHPLNPDEAYIAFVHGLGTRVVEAGMDFISVTVNRETGKVTSFGNRRLDLIHDTGHSDRAVQTLSEYRQERADYYSFDEQGVVSAPLSGVDIERFMRVEAGTLMSYEDLGGDPFDWHIYQRRPTSFPIGIAPFQNPESLTNLIGILTYLSAELGHPIQIEGAFTSVLQTEPFLYQLIKVPNSLLSAEPIDIHGADMFSSSVIGICDCEMPLVYAPNLYGIGFGFEPDEFNNEQTRLDDEYKKTGYALVLKNHRASLMGLTRLDDEYKKTGYALVLRNHRASLIELTPNCKVRISINEENLSSHAITLTRFLQDQNPEAGLVLAMEADLSDAIKQEHGLNDEGIGWTVFPDARIRADGRNLAVFLKRKQKPTALWWSSLGRIFGIR